VQLCDRLHDFDHFSDRYNGFGGSLMGVILGIVVLIKKINLCYLAFFSYFYKRLRCFVVARKGRDCRKINDFFASDWTQPPFTRDVKYVLKEWVYKVRTHVLARCCAHLFKL